MQKTKYKYDCGIKRCKARLVVFGCKQRYREDYDEPFASVIKTTIIRTLLRVIAKKHWSRSPYV